MYLIRYDPLMCRDFMDNFYFNDRLKIGLSKDHTKRKLTRTLKKMC